MKKLFTLLLVALVGMLPMMAQTEVTATFDFTDLANLDPNPTTIPTGITQAGSSRSGFYYKCNGEYSVSEKGVTLTPQLDDTGFNTIAFYQKSPAYLQMATSTKLNFATEEGYTIKSITFEFNGTGAGFTTTGSGSYSDGVYTAGDDETDVTLISSLTQKISKVTVILNHAGGSGSEGPEIGSTTTATYDFVDYTTLSPEPSFSGNKANWTEPFETKESSISFTGTPGNQYLDKSSSYMRLAAGTLTLSAKSGYEITGATFATSDNWSMKTYMTANSGTLTNDGPNYGAYEAVWTTPQTTSATFTISGVMSLTKLTITLVYVGGDEGPHVPEALSYVLGGETVAMTDFKAENVEIAAGSTLLFTDADGYAYGAAEAGTTLATGTATELTEYAPADAASACAFTVAANAIYNIAVSFKGDVPTVTLTKVSEPLVDADGNSVATFNWALPSSLNPAVTPTFYAHQKTFTANGISVIPEAVSMFAMDSQYPNVVSSTDGTYLRMNCVSILKVTAPAGKTIVNVKIEGIGFDETNTFTFYEGSVGTSTLSDGVITLKPTYQTNELTLEAKGTVKATYMTVTYSELTTPTALNYVVDGGTPVAMTHNDSDNSFTATDVTIGEWGKDGSIKFTSAWMDMMYGQAYACGAATEGEVAEAGTAISMVSADNLPVSAWHAYSVAPGVYTVTVSFATGMPVMTLTKTADLKQPLPTTMHAIIQGFDEPLALFAADNSFLANDVTIGTALGQTMTIYFAESEDITDGRTYGAAEAGEAYNFNNWTNTLTEYPAGTSANRFTIPSGVYSIDVSTSGEELKVRLSKTAELAPTVLYAYDGSTLKEMTADTEGKTFTLTDYEIGAWETAGTLKFTCAFMDMAFGSTWAWGAATEGEEAEAGTAYTMTGKENMPVSEWFGYSVAGGIYTVEVSFATGSAVMTLTRTGDFDQPKPTTMYLVSDALEAPVELTLMGNSFLANDVTIGTALGQTMTIYFAESEDITDGRTYGAAEADEAYNFNNWTNTLTEYPAGTSANRFTIPSGVYSIDVNTSGEELKLHLSKTAELAPAVLYAYDGSSLKEMTANTETKTFTLTDYEIGAWETAGSLKFTCAFLDMAFGSTWAWGAATEGEEAEAGTAYTMTGKENMPVSEWFGYSVAGGIYTVEVSFATGSAVMTLTRTGDFDQPKPTTMYLVSDALEAPVELTLMGNSFLATEEQSVTLGTEPGQTVTVYFAETATITDGRTWGAATADQAYDFEAWTNDLTEFAAGETPNAFTLPSAIYNVDVNITNDTYKVRISKKDDLSGIENINAADAEVEYYNLQGVRIANPTTGVYIRVQGNKATKVSIR